MRLRMQNNMLFTNKVIVFGNSHHNSLGLIRSLGEAGLQPDLILYGGNDKSFVAKSRYIGKCWHVDTIESGYNLLLSIYKNEKQKPFLFFPNDKVAEYFDARYDELKDYFHFQNAGKSNGLSPYFDKSYLLEKAKNWGFHVPYTIVHKKEDELPRNIDYPCLIKPLKSAFGKKSDIRICNSEEELTWNIDHLSDICEKFLIQKYIKKEYEVSILGISLKNSVLLPGMIRKIREYPVGKGSTSWGCLQEIPNDFDIAPIENAMKTIGYTGLFSAEYMKSGEKYYLLEINFRNDGNGHVITAAGMNQPYLFCLDALGNNVDEKSYNVKYPFYFMSNSDINQFKDGNITLRELLRCYRQADTYLQYWGKDPKPTSGKREFRVALAKAIIKRIIRK
ncbi:MAG: hypothetical protein Q4F69_00665 [Bacteroidia bacterium]|nr:hypothetical protein [Bacteroidia bacterium]